MRLEPGFAASLREDINSIWPEFRARHQRRLGLTEEGLVNLAVNQPSEDVAGVELPSAGDLDAADDITWSGFARAEAAMADGKVAYVILAGGMGTRLGGPKALARVPEVGVSLLAHKLVQAGPLPKWVMTSPGLTPAIQDHLSGQAIGQGWVFEQFESYCLTPDNRISFLTRGVPMMHPTGHGDVGAALVESGLLDDNPQVEHCIIVNVDNVMASPSAQVLAHHLASGADVTCEIVERQERDRGGCPVWHGGKIQVMEPFRLPDEVAEASKWTSTNTMIIKASALRTVMGRFHRIRRQVGTKLVIQHERLLQEYTEAYSTRYVIVPREERYLPVKDAADLALAGERLDGNKVR